MAKLLVINKSDDPPNPRISFHHLLAAHIQTLKQLQKYQIDKFLITLKVVAKFSSWFKVSVCTLNCS